MEEIEEAQRSHNVLLELKQPMDDLRAAENVLAEVEERNEDLAAKFKANARVGTYQESPLEVPELEPGEGKVEEEVYQVATVDSNIGAVFGSVRASALSPSAKPTGGGEVGAQCAIEVEAAEKENRMQSDSTAGAGYALKVLPLSAKK